MRLGRHLLLGLLLSFAALGLFVFLSEGPTDFDRSIWQELYRYAVDSPRLTDFLIVITHIGDGRTLAVFGLMVAGALFWRRHHLLALVWCASLMGGVLNQLLKQVFVRDRPPHPLIGTHGYSFPSGHTTGSIVVYGMLAYLLLIAVRRRWLGITLAAGLGVLIVLIGFSRIYLGAHWISDVVGGFCVGLVWLGCCIAAIERVRRRRLHMNETAAVAAPPADR
jgi:undecaprenyl-diphosphatase